MGSSTSSPHIPYLTHFCTVYRAQQDHIHILDGEMEGTPNKNCFKFTTILTLSTLMRSLYVLMCRDVDEQLLLSITRQQSDMQLAHYPHPQSSANSYQFFKIPFHGACPIRCHRRATPPHPEAFLPRTTLFVRICYYMNIDISSPSSSLKIPQ